jgi:hypothetical protein
MERRRPRLRIVLTPPFPRLTSPRLRHGKHAGNPEKNQINRRGCGGTQRNSAAVLSLSFPRTRESMSSCGRWTPAGAGPAGNPGKTAKIPAFALDRRTPPRCMIRPIGRRRTRLRIHAEQPTDARRKYVYCPRNPGRNPRRKYVYCPRNSVTTEL